MLKVGKYYSYIREGAEIYFKVLGYGLYKNIPTDDMSYGESILNREYRQGYKLLILKSTVEFHKFTGTLIAYKKSDLDLYSEEIDNEKEFIARVL